MLQQISIILPVDRVYHVWYRVDLFSGGFGTAPGVQELLELVPLRVRGGGGEGEREGEEGGELHRELITIGSVDGGGGWRRRTVLEKKMGKGRVREKSFQRILFPFSFSSVSLRVNFTGDHRSSRIFSCEQQLRVFGVDRVLVVEYEPGQLAGLDSRLNKAVF